MSAIPKYEQEADGKLRNELAIAHYKKSGEVPKWNRETLQLLHSFSMSDGEISELWKGQQPPLVGVARKRNSFWEVNYPKECPPEKVEEESKKSKKDEKK